MTLSKPRKLFKNRANRRLPSGTQRQKEYHQSNWPRSNSRGCHQAIAWHRCKHFPLTFAKISNLVISLYDRLFTLKNARLTHSGKPIVDKKNHKQNTMFTHIYVTLQMYLSWWHSSSLFTKYNIYYVYYVWDIYLGYSMCSFTLMLLNTLNCFWCIHVYTLKWII